MRGRITPSQRERILEMLEEGKDRQTIASSVEVTLKQVLAVAAHRTMGTYTGAALGPEKLSTEADEVAFPTGKLVPFGRKAEVVGARVDSSMRPGAVLLGTDSRTDAPIFWNPHPEWGSANPHVLILGESGYGKTYATSCLVAELVQTGVPSVIFDYGQGFSTAQAPKAFREWAKPVEFELNRDGIALNPLQIFPVDLHGPATVAQRVADTLVRVYPRIGVQQHSVLRRAVLELLSDSGIHQHDRRTWKVRPPHFKNLERKLSEYGTDSSAGRRHVALSAASHVSTLFVFDTFRSNGLRLTWNNLLANCAQVWILQLGGLESSVERAVTEFLLWNLIRFVETQGPGPLRCFVVLDEAHKLSFSPGSPVEKLLREGRKFGLGVILASQQPEDFSPVAFANTATKVVFQVADERGMISRQLHRKAKNVRTAAEIQSVITKLPRGAAYVVTQNAGYVIKIADFDERVSRWFQACRESTK